MIEQHLITVIGLVCAVIFFAGVFVGCKVTLYLVSPDIRHSRNFAKQVDGLRK